MRILLKDLSRKLRDNIIKSQLYQIQLDLSITLNILSIMYFIFLKSQSLKLFSNSAFS